MLIFFFIKKHEIASDITDNLQGKKCNVSFNIEKALKKEMILCLVQINFLSYNLI